MRCFRNFATLTFTVRLSWVEHPKIVKLIRIQRLNRASSSFRLLGPTKTSPKQHSNRPLMSKKDEETQSVRNSLELINKFPGVDQQIPANSWGIFMFTMYNPSFLCFFRQISPCLQQYLWIFTNLRRCGTNENANLVEQLKNHNVLYRPFATIQLPKDNLLTYPPFLTFSHNNVVVRLPRFGNNTWFNLGGASIHFFLG